MCGLFGFTSYGNTKSLSQLTNELAFESAIRGTDACGIAYRKGKRIRVDRYATAAYNVHFKHPDDVRVLIGHTRHATQGEAKCRQNNHPFFGKTGDTGFALAHNGIITNERELRKEHRLPHTDIETDSFVAVQLLETETTLTVSAIRHMAEAVKGSFSFAILDDHDNLHLVRGDSPISVLNFPSERLYVFASTEDILWRALVGTQLFESLKAGLYSPVPLGEGDILTVRPDGDLHRETFAFRRPFLRPEWWSVGLDPLTPYCNDFALGDEDDSDYLAILKDVAMERGVDPDDVDALLAEGFSYEEIEDMVYFGVEM